MKSSYDETICEARESIDGPSMSITQNTKSGPVLSSPHPGSSSTSSAPTRREVNPTNTPKSRSQKRMDYRHRAISKRQQVAEKKKSSPSFSSNCSSIDIDRFNVKGKQKRAQSKKSSTRSTDSESNDQVLSPYEKRVALAEELCNPTSIKIWNRDRIGLTEHTATKSDYYRLVMTPKGAAEKQYNSVKNIMGSQAEAELPCVLWNWDLEFRALTTNYPKLVLGLAFTLGYLTLMTLMLFTPYKMPWIFHSFELLVKSLALMVVTALAGSSAYLTVLAYIGDITSVHEEAVIDNFALSCLLGSRNCDIPKEVLKSRLLSQRSRMIGLTEDVLKATDKSQQRAASSHWEVFIAGQIMASGLSKPEMAWAMSGF